MEGTETAVAEAAETGAPESAPAEAAAPAAGAEKRSYTPEEVSEIVRKRLEEHSKPWSEFGKPDELKARLTRAQQIEQWAETMRRQFGADPNNRLPAGRTAAPVALSEEDKKVQAYLERMYPGLGKMKETQEQLMQGVSFLHQARWQSVTETNRERLAGEMTKAGYRPEFHKQLEDWVSDSIRRDPKDHEAYVRTGDQAIVKKHFDAVHKALQAEGFIAKPASPAAGAAKAAQAGKKTAGLPPRMPAAGVPAPTSGTRKMNDQERIAAAYARFKEAQA
jgi:hypothetical protein